MPEGGASWDEDDGAMPEENDTESDECEMEE